MSKKSNMFNNKTVLITGGCGFLGKMFCEAIIEANGIPIILDIYKNNDFIDLSIFELLYIPELMKKSKTNTFNKKLIFGGRRKIRQIQPNLSKYIKNFIHSIVINPSYKPMLLKNYKHITNNFIQLFS